MSDDNFIEQTFRQGIIDRAVRALTRSPYGYQALEEDEARKQIAELNDINKLYQILGYDQTIDLVRGGNLTLQQVSEYSPTQAEGIYTFFRGANNDFRTPLIEQHEEFLRQFRELNNDDIVHQIYHSSSYSGIFHLIKKRELTFSDVGKYTEDQLTSLNRYANMIAMGEMSLADAANIPAETALASRDSRLQQDRDRSLPEIAENLGDYVAKHERWDKYGKSREEKIEEAVQAAKRARMNFSKAPEIQLLESAAARARENVIERSIEYAIDNGKTIENPRDFVRNMREFLAEHKMTHQLLKASAERERPSQTRQS